MPKEGAKRKEGALAAIERKIKRKKGDKEKASVDPPPVLLRPLPPTHIQKVGTRLELEVVAEEGKEKVSEDCIPNILHA